MFRYLFIISAVALLTGCITPKKYTGFVQAKVRDFKTSNEINSSRVTFDLSALDTMNNHVVCTQVKKQFIPAIVYWQWNFTIKCEIDPKIVAQLFRSSFLQHADSLKLFSKLKKEILEIKIERIPNSFVYTDKGWATIPLMSYLEAIYPEDQNLVISYRLVNTDLSGQLTAFNKSKPLRNSGKTPKKFTWLYVDHFKNNTESMAREIVEQLMKVL